MPQSILGFILVGLSFALSGGVIGYQIGRRRADRSLAAHAKRLEGIYGAAGLYTMGGYQMRGGAGYTSKPHIGTPNA